MAGVGDFRHARLAIEQFDTLLEAQVLIGDWRKPTIVGNGLSLRVDQSPGVRHPRISKYHEKTDE
jgi:hypothetical protein